MNYFLSYFTEDVFTWFLTLPPNSFLNWEHLETLFPEQIFEGEARVSIIYVGKIQRKCY